MCVDCRTLLLACLFLQVYSLQVEEFKGVVDQEYFDWVPGDEESLH